METFGLSVGWIGDAGRQLFAPIHHAASERLGVVPLRVEPWPVTAPMG